MTKIFSQFSKDRMSLPEMVSFGSRLFLNSVPYSLNRNFGFLGIVPKYVRFSITNKCDSRCTTCHIWNYYDRYPERQKDELTFDEFKQFLDNNPFLEDVILTGGQTTLHPDIIKLWLYLDKKGFRTGSPTNVVDFDTVTKVHGTVLENLSGKQTHMMSISCDGIGEEHEKIRGIKGEFKNILRLVDWIQDKQLQFPFFKFSISHNLTPSNHNTFLDFVDFWVEKGLRPSQITFRPTQYMERNKLLNKREIVGQEFEKDVLRSIRHVTNKYPQLKSYYTRLLPKYFAHPRKQTIPCYAGFSCLFMDAHWNVFACTAMESSPLGNLRDTNFRLKPIWRNSKTKAVQMAIKHNKCPNCWTRCYSGYSMLSSPSKILSLGLEKVLK